MKKKLRKFIFAYIGLKLNLTYWIAPKKAANSSLKLFLTPQKGRIKPEQTAFLNSAQQEKIKIDGTSIQTYFWKGSKPAVILVHGWESNAYRWKDLIVRLLENDYAVYAVDAPAHGASGGEFSNVPLYAKAISYLIKQHQITYAVGHSLGGFTLLYQQVMMPVKNLEKMVFMAPATEMVNIVNVYRHTLGLSNKLMAGFEEVFEQEYHYKLSEFSIQKLLPEFPIPTLFIHDKEDRIVSYKESEKVSKQWDNSKLILTSGLNHGLRNDKVVSDVIDFLNEKIN